ncbi:MAG: response regulator [Flavobacteriales bacterium]|jgi:DNA-binding response OmpR family regulator|nr:response regulator [Flavobacteriales bacterium]
MPHVLVIEDDALVRKLLEKRLQQAGWQVSTLRDGRQALEHCQRLQPDLLLLDLGLPHVDGLSVVEALRAQGHSLPILVLTGYELPRLQATVHSTGANDLVQKPYDPDALLDRMQALLAA